MKKLFLAAITGISLLSGAAYAKSDAVLLKEAEKNVVTIRSLAKVKTTSI